VAAIAAAHVLSRILRVGFAFQTLKTGGFRHFRRSKRTVKKQVGSSPGKACALQIDPFRPRVHLMNIRFNSIFEETD
jgi:hypothetical protein